MTATIDPDLEEPAGASTASTLDDSKGRDASPGSRWRDVSGFRVVVGVLALCLGVLIVYPLAVMVKRVFFPDASWSSTALDNVLSDPAIDDIVLDTFSVLAVSGVGAMLIGGLFAFVNERTDARMGWLSRVLPLTPLLLPPIALSVGWVFLADKRAGYLNVAIRALLSRVGVDLDQGPLNIASWWGLVFIYTLWLVPFVYLVLSAALRNVDPALEEASRISGAGPLRTAFRVSLPTIKPAMGSAALLMIVSGVAVFSIGRTVGVPAGITVLSVHIVSLVQSYPSQLDEAVVVGLFVLAVVASAALLQRRLANSSRHATIGGKGMGRALVQLGPWRWVVRAMLLTYLAATSVLPLVGLLLVSMQPFWSPSVDWGGLSLDNFSRLLSEGSFARTALKTSVMLGVAGATTGILIAALLSFHARQRKGLEGRLIDAVTKAPGAISHVVIGVAFIVTLAGPPFRLHGTIAILFLAYLVIYMPQASIASGSAIDQLGGELLEASAISGARPGRTFGRIALPLMVPGLVAGWALLFVVMAGDLTASALLSGANNPVVGFVFLDIYENGTYSMVAAMGAVMGFVSATVVGVVLAVAKPRFGAMSGSG